MILFLILLASAGRGTAIAEAVVLSTAGNAQLRGEGLKPSLLETLSPAMPANLKNCEGNRAMIAQQAGQILAQIKDIEFNQIEYGETSAKPYGFIKGLIPVLISAPHGAQHYRRDHWKGEDEYTSSLAIVLGQLTGAHVLYVRNRIPEDPNQGGPSKYKNLIRQVVDEYGIQFVIDIHGSDKKRPYKVDVGIISMETAESSCPVYWGIIQEAFAGFQEPLFNQAFPAKGRGTITSFCKNVLGIEAAQFEINAKYRVLQRKPDSSKARAGRDPDFRAEDQDVLELISRMTMMIAGIHEKMKEECKIPPTPGPAAISVKIPQPAADSEPASAELMAPILPTIP